MLFSLPLPGVEAQPRTGDVLAIEHALGVAALGAAFDPVVAAVGGDLVQFLGLDPIADVAGLMVARPKPSRSVASHSSTVLARGMPSSRQTSLSERPSFNSARIRSASSGV